MFQFLWNNCEDCGSLLTSLDATSDSGSLVKNLFTIARHDTDRGLAQEHGAPVRSIPLSETGDRAKLASVDAWK